MNTTNMLMLGMGVGLAIVWPSLFAWAATGKRWWIHLAVVGASMVTGGWVILCLIR